MYVHVYECVCVLKIYVFTYLRTYTMCTCICNMSKVVPKPCLCIYVLCISCITDKKQHHSMQQEYIRSYEYIYTLYIHTHM